MITVMLADDHKLVREALQYLLEASGDIYITATAANGQEAVEQTVQSCPDVAVIDVSMPVMDGIEASRHIQKACPHTRVVMLSMYNSPEYVARALRTGARGYVLKDAACDELVEAIHAVSKGRNYFSPTIREFVGDV